MTRTGSGAGNGSGNGTWRPTDLPVWVRAVAIVGIPGVIAFFLVYVGASDIPKISRGQDQVLHELLYNRKLIEQTQLRQDQQYRLLQRICAQRAKDDLERDRCFD